MFGRRQRGATLLGTLIIIAILGLGVYAGIRLTPIYVEYMAVVRALDQTASEASGNAPSPQSLRNSLESRWAVDDIKSLDWKDVAIVKSATGFTMEAQYRAEAPFVSNVSLVVDFDKSVQVTQ